jgi:hypothetical protein
MSVNQTTTAITQTPNLSRRTRSAVPASRESCAQVPQALQAAGEGEQVDRAQDHSVNDRPEFA